MSEGSTNNFWKSSLTIRQEFVSDSLNLELKLMNSSWTFFQHDLIHEGMQNHAWLIRSPFRRAPPLVRDIFGAI